MDYGIGIEKLVELIFARRFQITSEMTEPGFFFPCCLVTDDFRKILHQVLFSRCVIIGRKWFNLFDSYTKNMLPTQESYLKNLIFACYQEQYCHQHAFDKFISMCSFVEFFRCETLKKKGLDFGYLNYAVVLELYEHSLQDSIRRCGGFFRLCKYIREQKYPSCNWLVNYTFGNQDPSNCCDLITQKNIEEEIIKEFNTFNSVNKNLYVIKENTIFITQKVLSSISGHHLTVLGNQGSNLVRSVTWLQGKEKTAEEKGQIQADLTPIEDVSEGSSNSVPTVVGSQGSNWVIGATVLQDKEKTAEENIQMHSDLKPLEAVSEKSSNSVPTMVDNHGTNLVIGATVLHDKEKTVEEKRQIQTDLKTLEDVSQGTSNSCSETIHEAKEKAWCEVIVQTVMRYNHAKAADLEPIKSFVLKQAEEILEYLKDSIKSLINVLDEYEKEQML